MIRSAAAILAISFAAGCALAQTNPVIAEQKMAYESNRNNLIKAAEKMPEADYSFKPTPEMQSFGERIAHIAGQMGTCSMLTGERKPNPAMGKTSKDDIVAALKASFDACDAAWASMNDKTAAEMVAGRGGATALEAFHADRQHHAQYGAVRLHLPLHAAQGRGPSHQRPDQVISPGTVPHPVRWGSRPPPGRTAAGVQ